MSAHPRESYERNSARRANAITCGTTSFYRHDWKTEINVNRPVQTTARTLTINTTSLRPITPHANKKALAFVVISRVCFLLFIETLMTNNRISIHSSIEIDIKHNVLK